MLSTCSYAIRHLLTPPVMNGELTVCIATQNTHKLRPKRLLHRRTYIFLSYSSSLLLPTVDARLTASAIEGLVGMFLFEVRGGGISPCVTLHSDVFPAVIFFVRFCTRFHGLERLYTERTRVC